jgi:hypothetical protein
MSRKMLDAAAKPMLTSAGENGAEYSDEIGISTTENNTAERPKVWGNEQAGTKQAADAKQLVKRYEPTPGERSAIEAHFDRRRRRKPLPRVKLSVSDGVGAISPDHRDKAAGVCLLMEALGTADESFLEGLLQQLAMVAATEGDERDLNFLLALVKGVEPKDQVEAMLAAQMAAVHNATMMSARRLNHAQNVQQQDSAERAISKLARTFATQVEALKRYRSAGEQTVRVEHVTVNEGGQAIVGHVTHRGRGFSKNAEPTP